MGTNEVRDGCDLGKSADEARELDRQVVTVGIERRDRREISGEALPAHLVHVLGTSEVAESMLAQVDESDRVAEMVDDEIACRLGHEDLAAVADRAKARRPDDRLPRVVPVRRSTRLPRVDSHPHLQRNRCGPRFARQCPLRFGCSEDRIRGARERGHNRVTLTLRQRSHPSMGRHRSVENRIVALHRGSHRLGLRLPPSR